MTAAQGGYHEDARPRGDADLLSFPERRRPLRRMNAQWALAVDAWATFLLASGTSPETVTLRKAHSLKAGRELSVPPRDLTLEQLTDWLSAQEWAPNTRRSYRASLRGFYAYLIATGAVASSPAHQLPPVRVPRGRPRPAPESAVQNALYDGDERVQLAVRLAAHCGLRRGEIARTRREDVDEDLLGYTLRVVGKGGHVRLVPLPRDLARDLLAAPAGWIFPSPVRAGQPLTAAYLGKIVSRALPGDLTTHTLRHRAGTIAYARTRDLRAVQEFLGHAKPETTALYTEVPGSSIRAAMEAAAA